MSFLVLCELLGLPVNTLTASDKYFLCNRGNLPHSIKMQSSQTYRTFSQSFAAFLKTTSNFKHLGKKDDPQSLRISKITDCEIRG